MEHYKVGEIAKKVGINIETLRYYEKIEIMPEPKRKESRYRFYNESDLRRLQFIKRAKELGFTLKEIKELLSIKIDTKSSCGDIKKLAEEKIEDIGRKVEDLHNIMAHLEILKNKCVNEEISSEDCPIVKSLER